MMRIARVATVLFVVVVCGAAGAAAQTSAAGSSESRAYLEFNAGATLGHTSDKSVGGEGGIRLMKPLDVFVEGGHIGNAATTDFDERAQKIATAVGASPSAVSKVNYFDAGVRYRFPVAAAPSVHPYLAFGVGAARVENKTTLSVNGTAVPPESLGVQFGTDLNGTETRPLVMIGGGATVNFATRYFADLSYRFGRISQQTDADGNIVFPTINTQRVQVGIGIRF